ncbi:MAG: ParB/RepB/Spo0J family partition protein [Candidatus Competibacteraceae bacterium]|nr:ParB/RepB/Spo0J family partition protein [Candidatus Competibacteraceae bacterium]
MKTTLIPVNQLADSKANVRKQGASDDLESLIASIRTLGVLQPLIVRRIQQDRFEVVAGQRRRLACQQLAGELKDGQVYQVPCIIVEKLENASALEISLSENIQRIPMNEFDQFEAFAKLIEHGQTVEDVASRFGITERLVKQRLALAGLIPAIKTIVQEENIRPSDTRLLALATPQQQTAWLAMYEDSKQNTPRGENLKRWLLGGEAISTSVALFDLAEYSAPLITDLFGDQVYFSDITEFWSLQNKAVTRQKDEFLAAGWEDVTVLEISHYFPRWDYQNVPKKQGGWVIIEMRSTGEVTIHEGLLPNSEVQRRQDQQQREANGPDEIKPQRGETTHAMQSYLGLHKAWAVRNALADDPTLALRLAVALIIGGGDPNWNIHIGKDRPANDDIKANISECPGQSAFQQRCHDAKNVLYPDGRKPRFSQKGELLEGTGYGGEPHTVTLLQRLLALSDEEVLGLLATAVASTLSAGTGLTELLGHRLGVDMRQHWQPDALFFKLLSDKAAMLAMASELGVTTSEKATVAQLRKALQQQAEHFTQGTWLPRYLEFPFASYGDRPMPEVRTAFDGLRAILDGSNEEEFIELGLEEDGGEDDDDEDFTADADAVVGDRCNEI